MSIDFTLNGTPVSFELDETVSVLDALRNTANLNAAKFGCGMAQCGACAVLLDGESVRSCVLPLSAVVGKVVTTLEGLGSEEQPHALQSAFVEEQALQCGYCTSGIIVTAAALLQSNPSPTTREIKAALAGHLCRCGAQPRIVKAVAKAANAAKDSSS